MLDWITKYFLIPPDSILIYGTYSYWMVALSILIAILASFMGLQLVFQTNTVSQRKAVLMLIGSIALGGGVWSMHFIGMLAFNLCTSVEYGWGLTLLSLLPGIGASWVALNYINSHRKGLIPLLIGGVLVGLGIGTMHYMGMAAMEMAPLLRYDPAMFALSIVVAITLSILALWIRFGLAGFFNTRYQVWKANLAASVVMGVAISGTHYIGMVAARFINATGIELSEHPAPTSIYLALGVSGATIAIIFLVLGMNIIYKYRDISRRALESERRLRATMDTAVDGIITIDSQGTVISANHAVETLLGWPEAELLGHNVKMLVPEPFQSAHDGYLERYLKTGEARIIGEGREVEALHRNGEKIDIRLGIGHVKMANNDFFVAFISDIRNRLKMEQALRENEEQFRSLITNIPGIAFRCMDDKDWSMIFISDAVEAITGYPAQDFILPNPKRSFTELYHPDDCEKIYSTVLEQESYSLEYRIIRRDGAVRWVMEHGTYIKEETGDEVWLDGFIMDITERYEMVRALRQEKEKAEQAASARATFLANMSHEIRTPMNAIIGFSDILLETPLKTDQQRHLKTINHSAKSLLHLLNDVLDSAKLDKGKLELELRPFSLIQEVDAVISTLWLQARNKGLTLVANVSPKLEENYSGSPERLRQVLTNLINNAIKFTPNGHVKLDIRPLTDTHVEFLIEDTGIGMSQEQLQSVFDPFTQADASMSRRFGGTGLGTTISKQLVELMCGKISAKSELGKGTQFRFVLPLSPTNESALKTQETVKLPPLTILVVDDIQQNIDLLSVLLKRDGHTVLTARDGKQALIRMNAETQIDLVLMDVQMPVMDGLTASKARRDIELNEGVRYIPIIALTASVLEDDRLAAQAAGMDGFANKPVEYSSLCYEAARVLNICLLNEKSIKNEKNDCTLIDEKKGISLWGGKDEYYRQLEYFIKENEAVFEDLNNQKLEQLKYDAHKLKGICGNLSLTNMMRKFEKLEAIISDKPEETPDALALILSLFYEVKNKVYEVTKNKEKLNTSDPVELNELIELLNNLKDGATQNEVDEVLLSRLFDFNHSIFEADTQQVYQALNDFEFGEAEQRIQALLNKINHYKGENTYE